MAAKKEPLSPLKEKQFPISKPVAGFALLTLNRQRVRFDPSLDGHPGLIVGEEQRKAEAPLRLAEQDLPLSENHRRWSLRDIVKARAECLADLESVTERNRLILLRGR